MSKSTVAAIVVCLALATGWAPFLYRNLNSISMNLEGWLTAIVAAVVFTVLLWITVRIIRGPTDTDGNSRPAWTLLASLKMTVLLGVMFWAGISMIGVVHQSLWLANSPEPLKSKRYRGQDWYEDASRYNLKQFGLGLHNYVEIYGDFLPPGATFNEHGRPMHGWLSLSLMGANYSDYSIDRTVPWNHPNNLEHYQSLIPEFLNPKLGDAPQYGKDGYALTHFAGNSHVMNGVDTWKFQDISDGTSQTLLLGEVNDGFKAWGNPVNWRDPSRGLKGGPHQFGGPAGSDAVMFLMLDGGVENIDNGIAPDVLRALSTPAGGDSADGF